MEDHNLEKIFRDKLKNLECHEDLPDFPEIGMFVQPKRSVPAYKGIAAIAVILISICTGSYFVVSEYLRDQAASETFLSVNIRLGANNEKKSSINDTPDFLSVSESSVNAEEFGKDRHSDFQVYFDYLLKLLVTSKRRKHQSFYLVLPPLI